MSGRRATRGPLSTYWLVQLACWLAYAAISVLALLPSLPLERVPGLLVIKGTRALLGLPISHLLRLVYLRVTARGGGPAPRLVAAIIGSVIFGPIWYVMSFLLAGLLLGAGQPFVWASVPHGSLDLSIALLGWSAAYFGWCYWRDAEAASQRAATAQAQSTRAQLDALRFQLNPHFLFNALTSIRACMLEDQARAREMVTSLAGVLRYALTPATSGDMPLREELDVVRQYLDIELARFGDQLIVGIDVSAEAEEQLIPGFLLHPLVENALLHGRRTTRGALEVSIQGTVRDAVLRLVIVNTGSLRPAALHDDLQSGAAGIGLRNVTERLAHRYPGSHVLRVSEGDGRVRVELELQLPVLAAPRDESAAVG